MVIDWVWFTLPLLLTSASGLPAAAGSIRIGRELRRDYPEARRIDVRVEAVFIGGWCVLAAVTVVHLVVR